MLIEHEHARQKRYRHALADLAHSLKTPLTLMRNALAAEARDALGTTLEEQLARMDRIVDYQLQRAATSGKSKNTAPLPIKPVAEKILASLAKVYLDKKVDAELFIGSEVCFRGDEGDLMELLGNLLDNAYKWCRKSVRLTVKEKNRRVTISVEDDGPGINESQAEHLLQRGVRADQAMPGHGIGLAVACDIVHGY